MKMMIVEIFHMYVGVKNMSERRNRVALGVKRRRELKLNIMPGIKRNYPRYASIISFMEFRRQPQRAKSRHRKGKKRADEEGRKLIGFIFATIPIYRRIRVYILLRYSYRLQRRLAELPR